jgi:AraC-like DNA-binding protein
LLPYYQLGTAEKTHFISAVVNNNFFRSFPKEYALLFDYKFQRAFIPISNLGFILYTLYYLHKKKSNVLMKPKISKMIYSIINIISICSFPHILYIIYASVKSPLQADLAFRLANNNLEIFYLITLTTPLSFLLFPKLIYGFNPNASIVHYIKTIFANRKNSTLENNHSLRGDLPDDSVQIMEYLEKEKPYLNTEFSLHDLSRELNISHLKVSNFFNKQLNTPYPEYRNRLRVNHAIQLFKEGMHAQMSIEGIATVCGFKNKSRFYAAFKAEYQKTPTEWIEKNVAIIEHERESTNFKNI